MDIFEQWKEIESKKLNQSPIQKEDIMEAIYQESISIMDQLKLRLKYKIYWVIAIGTGLFIFGLFNLSNMGVLLGLALVLTYYVYGYFSLSAFHKKMGTTAPNMSTLNILKHNRDMIKGALASEESTGTFFFPIVIASSLIISGSLKGMEFIEIVTDVKMLTVFAVSILVIVPIIMNLAKKMNKSAYGEYIESLEDSIRKMEEVR